MAHSDAQDHGQHYAGEKHHVFGADMLKKTFLILVGLTFLTVILALWERGFVNFFGLEWEFPALPLGWLSVPVALAIAGTKAYWVASRFMGLKAERGTNMLVFIGSIIFLVIFFGFTYIDYAFRDTFYDLSAIPTDVLEEEELRAREEAGQFQEAYDAAPLVGQPDPELFGPAASAARTEAAGTETTPTE